MKNTYLYLYPDTFWFDGKNKMLLYKSTTHQYLEVEREPALVKLQNKLMHLESLYSIPLNDSLFTQYNHLWSKITEHGFGEIVSSSEQERPVSYPPVLKMNQNLESIRHDYQKRQAGYILHYLYEVTVYFSGNNSVQEAYSKQTIYPITHNQTLSPEQLKSWFEKTKGGALKTVNFVGSPNILPEYREVFQFLRESGTYLNYYILWEEFNQIHKTGAIPGDFNIVILYTGDALEQVNPAYDAVCLIGSNEEVQVVEKRLSEKTDFEKNVELIPIYTGTNLDFFQDHCYTSKEELLSGNLLKQEIFARMELNTNYFGKLTILPNGSIYSNLNTPSLGNLNDSLYEIIFKELQEGKNWMNARSGKSCRECRFRWLCPPISNYEFILGRDNLCTIDEVERGVG